LLIYHVFIADTIRHAVTLTFQPSTLNVCGISAGTWLNSVPNSTEIEQLADELQRFKNWKFGRRPPSWIWPEVNFYNSATSGVPYCISYLNLNTIEQSLA